MPRSPDTDADEASRPATRWAGVPAEDRKAERRTLLLDAALELLGTEGLGGTTVRAVCQTARLNPRYFYESFDDLDALVVALYDRLVEELHGEVVDAMASAGEDPEAQTRAILDRIVGYVVDDPRRARVLYVEALGNEALNRRRIETGHAVVATLDRFVTARDARLDGAPLGAIGAAIVVGGTTELLLSWLDGRIACTREELVDDTTALLLAVGSAADVLADRRADAPTGRGTRRRRSS